MGLRLRRRWAAMRYVLDRYVVRPGFTMVAIVVSFLALLVLLGVLRAGFVRASGGEVERGRGGLRQLWITWLEMTDPGTQAYDIDSSGFVKVFAVIAGIVGIILLSAVIAVMTTALTQKIEELRAGHTLVVEDGHTLVLGWNDRIVDILQELIEANESESSASVVILADRPKVDMDEYLRVHVPDRRTTRVTTRTGVPTSNVDLAIASPSTARTAIVLRSEHARSAHDGGCKQDVATLKAILALSLTERDEAAGPLHVVAEMVDDANRDIAETLNGGEVTIVSPDEMLAKIIVQCSRTRGLSTVYREVLSFRGAELYFHPFDLPRPLPFRDVLRHLPDGVPIGLRTTDGVLEIHPESSRPVVPGEDLLILAEDDSTIELLEDELVQGQVRPATGVVGARAVERCLLIGWTDKTATIVRELDDYVAPGSSVDIVVRNRETHALRETHELEAELQALQVRLLDADPHDPRALEGLDATAYDNVVLLSEACATCAGGEDTDAETLTMLLRMRRILSGAPDSRTKLISEVVEANNEALISEAGVDDIVISNSMVSSLIAQLSEDPSRKALFDDLFAEEGSEIYLKPAGYYFQDLPVELTFADVAAQAFERNEIAIGVRFDDASTDVAGNFGVRLNPDKRASLVLREHDAVVVVAVDEL